MGRKPLYKKILNTLKSGKEYKIVFIGDSLTSAEWVHPNWRDVFEYILKFSFEEFKEDDWWVPEWNLKFYNYALDGASSRDFLQQVSIAQKEIEPNLYIIMGTSNDIELGITVEEQIGNINSIFELLSNKDVIYTPDLYSNDQVSNERYEQYIEAILSLDIPSNINVFNGYEIYKDYPIEQFYTLDLDLNIDNTSEVKKDTIHPNSLGNIYIAKMFLEEIFGIKVKPELYLKDIRSDIVKYPRWT
ncbi:MAG: SGNH/GDSL hydrolase family protein [Candidatus Dojkabacteria bacterium]|jgi:lysophospholipase L1-like esterase|nr:SGNH/GDSL hydrolase family protein [Candidatus Dojkabacteria bacterium]